MDKTCLPAIREEPKTGGYESLGVSQVNTSQCRKSRHFNSFCNFGEMMFDVCPTYVAASRMMKPEGCGQAEQTEYGDGLDCCHQICYGPFVNQIDKSTSIDEGEIDCCCDKAIGNEYQKDVRDASCGCDEVQPAAECSGQDRNKQMCVVEEREQKCMVELSQQKCVVEVTKQKRVCVEQQKQQQGCKAQETKEPKGKLPAKKSQTGNVDFKEEAKRCESCPIMKYQQPKPCLSRNKEFILGCCYTIHANHHLKTAVDQFKKDSSDVFPARPDRDNAADREMWIDQIMTAIQGTCPAGRCTDGGRTGRNVAARTAEDHCCQEYCEMRESLIKWIRHTVKDLKSAVENLQKVAQQMNDNESGPSIGKKSCIDQKKLQPRNSSRKAVKKC